MRSIFPPSLLDIRINPPFPKSQFQKFQPQTSSPQNTLSQYFHPNSANVVISNRRLQNSSRPKYISRPVNKIHGSCSCPPFSPSSYYNISRQARVWSKGAEGLGRVARTMRKYTCTRESTGSRLYINTRWIRKLVVPKQLCVSQAWAARSRPAPVSVAGNGCIRVQTRELGRWSNRHYWIKYTLPLMRTDV